MTLVPKIYWSVTDILIFVYVEFQEISPPLVDDFLFICDDTYVRDEFLAMERSLLKTVGFDLGIPLSYSFLRRYAQVCSAMFCKFIFLCSVL